MALFRRFITGSPVHAWKRARTRSFARVLMYHRVVDDDCAPVLRGLLSGAITCSAFRRQLEYIDRHYQVVGLNDLLGQPGALRNKVAITFDDGYADNVYNAMPLLQAKNMPATVFMTAGLMESGAGIWRDRLARKIVAEGGKGLRFDDGKHFPFEGDYGRQMRAVEHWFRALPQDRREALLADQPSVDEDRFLDIDEMKTLQRHGITIQSHTVTHPYLPDTEETTAEWELRQSRSLLEEALQCPVDLLAYPYGGFTERTQAIARRAGYRAAFAAGRGLLRPETDPFAIPRIGTRQALGRFKSRITQSYKPE